MPRFRVIVPFEPVIHETLGSRVFTKIPDSDLAGGVRIRGTGDGYTAELEVEAGHPGAAKATAVNEVETFLGVLASWNHGFQIRTGGVRSELVDTAEPGSVCHTAPGVVAITASDTSVTEDHLQAVVQKATLDAEDALYRRVDELGEYIRNCLELNYLLVLSTSPSIRWLLAATGLEALAVGRLGDQQTVSKRLDPDQRRQLRRELGPVLETAGLDDLGERVVQRVLSTTVGPVAEHVYEYLRGLGIGDTSPEEIRRWWWTRGAIAHGGADDIEQDDLNHLITVFQTALRRTAGAEPIPPSGT